tara:strand:+ start:4481 stop:5176 length:696 start_codon:yes stop_codon:yes gene_type:complete
MSNVITIKNLTKSYDNGNLKVLSKINFTFQKGKIYSITGPSGSGKSTLLNLISLIDKPNNGNVVINNVDTTKIENDQKDILRSEKIGIIYQDKNLLNDFTAIENIYLANLAIKNSKRNALVKAKKLLTKFDLKKRQDHYPNELSGGEIQRVAICRAIINEPEIILADEPTGSLDSKNAKNVFKILMRLINKDRTIIFATHNIYFANLADCKLELKDGILRTANARIGFKTI